MFRKILCAVLALALISISGCSLASKAQNTSTTAPASVRTIREAKISKTWMMKQMEIDLAGEFPIVLTLKDGDKVEGFFYLVKGDNVSFTISGVSTIYTSKSADSETMRISSDRFSFTASQAQANHYTLTLNAGAAANGKSDTTVFLEIIYPVTGSVLVPIGTGTK
jgi:hypothetical protein